MTLRVEWHERLDTIEALEEPWRALEEAVVDRTALVRFDHVFPWYRHYKGFYGEPLLGAAWEGPELVGIAPMVRHKGLLGRVPVRRIDFAAWDAEGGEFLVADGRQEVIRHLIRSLAETPGYDVICLYNMVAGSRELQMVEGAAPERGLALEAQETCYARVDLKGGYEAYASALEASLKGNIRREFRRRAGRLAEAGGVALDGAHFETDLERIAACLERTFAINDASWKARERGGPLDIRHRAFYQDVMERFERLGMADVSILTIGGADAAYILGLAERGVYYDLTVSYKESFTALAPGFFLMREVLRTLPSFGIHTVISHGAHEYKRRWTKDFPAVFRVFLFPPRLRANVSRFLKFRMAPALGRNEPLFD